MKKKDRKRVGRDSVRVPAVISAPQTEGALPETFVQRMKQMLGGEEYAAFEAAQGRPCFRALRVNTLKKGWERFEEAPSFARFSLEPVPWAAHGFYYGEEDRPGKSPLHEAGLYYIQEPSAMAVGALSGVKPGERVLDLCAAPGGKSTHLAALMEGQGLLVSNEIHPARAKILSQNMERMGIRNAVVTNETPQRLAEAFPAYFDRVIVDAPCSGEGMFRREEQAIPNWSGENVEMCAARQDEILEYAAQMTAAGGTIVYSTCTFAPLEDEGTVCRFLSSHSDFVPVDLPAELGAERMIAFGFAPGRPDWAAELPNADLPNAEMAACTLRLWPHRLGGEGHFVAKFVKEGTAAVSAADFSRNPAGKLSLQGAIADKEQRAIFEQFLSETFTDPEWIRGVPVFYGNTLYLMPEKQELRGLKVLRPGLCAGEFRKNRFEPAHALALALSEEDVRSFYRLDPESGEAEAYLRGESIPVSRDRTGWILVTYLGYSVGWGKAAGGMLKNHYPKGLRK